MSRPNGTEPTNRPQGVGQWSHAASVPPRPRTLCGTPPASANDRAGSAGDPECPARGDVRDAPPGAIFPCPGATGGVGWGEGGDAWGLLHSRDPSMTQVASRLMNARQMLQQGKFAQARCRSDPVSAERPERAERAGDDAVLPGPHGRAPAGAVLRPQGRGTVPGQRRHPDEPREFPMPAWATRTRRSRRRSAQSRSTPARPGSWPWPRYCLGTTDTSTPSSMREGLPPALRHDRLCDVRRHLA